MAPPSDTGDPLADHARATTTLVTPLRENVIRRVAFQRIVGAEKRHGAGKISDLAATKLAPDALGIGVTRLCCAYFGTNARSGATRFAIPKSVAGKHVHPARSVSPEVPRRCRSCCEEP